MVVNGACRGRIPVCAPTATHPTPQPLLLISSWLTTRDELVSLLFLSFFPPSNLPAIPQTHQTEDQRHGLISRTR